MTKPVTKRGLKTSHHSTGASSGAGVSRDGQHERSTEASSETAGSLGGATSLAENDLLQNTSKNKDPAKKVGIDSTDIIFLAIKTRCVIIYVVFKQTATSETRGQWFIEVV